MSENKKQLTEEELIEKRKSLRDPANRPKGIKPYVVFTERDSNMPIAEYDVLENRWHDSVSNEDFFRYLKGRFETLGRFKVRFLDRIFKIKEMEKDIERGFYDEFSYANPDEFTPVFERYDEFVELFENAKPFTYGEIFKIEDDEFRAKVMATIEPGDMIRELGHKRVAVDGRNVKHKEYDKEGNFIGERDYDLVYEIHEVNISKLIDDGGLRRGDTGSDEIAYAIRCWDTSTNEEKWLWTEEKYKDKPLDAIAAACRVPRKILPLLEEGKAELVRQGDIFLAMTNEDVELTEDEAKDIVPLTSEQYFKFLKAQS